MSKPIKPSKNLVYCYACKHVTSNPSVIDGERQDRQDSQLVQELVSITQTMDKFKELGL